MYVCVCESLRGREREKKKHKETREEMGIGSNEGRTERPVDKVKTCVKCFDQIKRVETKGSYGFISLQDLGHFVA